MGRKGFIGVGNARASRTLFDNRIEFRDTASARDAGRVVVKKRGKVDLTRRGMSGEGRRGGQGFIGVRSARASRNLFDNRIEFRDTASARDAGRVVVEMGKKVDLTRRGISGEGLRGGQVTSDLFVRLAVILLRFCLGPIVEQPPGRSIVLVVFWGRVREGLQEARGCDGVARVGRFGGTVDGGGEERWRDSPHVVVDPSSSGTVICEQ